MIFTDNMHLHNAFIPQNPNIIISYSFFCALRPFYITHPKASDRKTCQCQYHENAKLILEVLKSLNSVETNKLEECFQLVCCSQASESCLLRTFYWPSNAKTNIQAFLQSKGKHRWNWSSGNALRSKEKMEFTFAPNLRSKLIPRQNLKWDNHPWPLKN